MSYCRPSETNHYVYPTGDGINFDGVYINNMYIDILVHSLALYTVDKDKAFDKDPFQIFINEGKNLLVLDEFEREKFEFNKHIKMPSINTQQEISLNIALNEKTITFDINGDISIISTDAFKIFLFVLTRRPEEMLRRYHHGLSMVYKNEFYDKVIFSF